MPPAGFKARYLKGQEAINALALCENRIGQYEKDLYLPDGHRDAMRIKAGWNYRTGRPRYVICAPWLLGSAFSI